MTILSIVISFPN